MTTNFFAPIVLTLVLALSGYGGGSDSKPVSSEQSNSTEVSSSTNTSKENADTKNLTSTISDQILIDQDGFRLTAKLSEIEEHMNGPEIPLLIENNSGKDVVLKCNNVSCVEYGFMEEHIFTDYISAGEVIDHYSLLEWSLKTAGLGRISIIKLDFVLTYSDSGDVIVETGPIVLKTPNRKASQETLTPNKEGTVILEDSDIKIKNQGITDDPLFGSKSINFYIENTSTENQTIQCKNLSINGFMFDSNLSCNISAGKATYDGILLKKKDLEKNAITDIEEIELSFVIFNSDGSYTVSSPITISN